MELQPTRKDCGIASIQPFFQVFHDSFRMGDSRRVVSLPRKQIVTLPSNRQNAENRCKSLEARIKKNANLRYVYYTHMLGYTQRLQVEIVDPDK